MEEGAWDRAVEQARAGEAVHDVEALTLDGLVKCAQGKLPKSKVFAPFTQLKRLSIANVGLSSLADFPSLPHLERLILSDNRIAAGLEHLVYAGLKALRELDLSNNKIQAVEDLKPLAQLKLESLDLYECPVTRGADYRAKVFGMMKSLRFLDKTDVTGNERPESDEEEEESEEEEEDVDDLNGDGDGADVEGEEEEGAEGDSKGVAVHEEDDDEGEDEERDDEGEDNEELEDEEEDEGGSYQEEVVAASGRGVVQGHVNNEHGSDEEEVEDEEDDNVEVQDIEEESEEEEVGEEDDEDAGVDEEEEDDEEEPASGAHVSTEGELDVQENEEDEEDENGELGEDEEQDEVEEDAVDNDEGEEEVEEEVEEEDEDDEEYGTKYLVQPIAQPEEDEGASDFEPGEDDEEEDEDFEDEDDEEHVEEPVGLKQDRKRMREETGEKEERPAKH